MNPRTSIDQLVLQGSANLERARKRMKADAEKLESTPEKEREIAQVDQLITLAMAACRRGQTIRGKRNPAFANLADLVKVRKALESRPVDPAAEGRRTLREVQELMRN